MSFERSMAIGKVGYCLVPGHPIQHKLEQQCWSKLRGWLHDSRVLTEGQYMADCERK